MTICAVVAGLAVAVSLFAQQSETAEQYINRLIREATGAQPIQEARSPKQRAMDNSFRTQFRSLIQLNRDFVAAINKVDKEKLKKLMTAESLADPAVGADTVKELDAYAALEQENGAKSDQIIAGVRHTLETADWLGAERARMLKSFDIFMTESQDGRHRYLEAQKAWVEVVDDLYRYAAQHKDAFKIENGKVTVSDESVLAEVNQRLSTANAKREDMLKAQQAYQVLQAQRLKTFGVDPKSVGMP